MKETLKNNKNCNINYDLIELENEAETNIG